MKPVFKLRHMYSVAAAAALLFSAGCGKSDESDDQPDQIFEVARGNFNIIVSANGTLDAIKRYRIECPPLAKKGLDIIEVVGDQTELKKGDKIIAFDDDVYLEELETREIKADDAEKNLMVLQQDYQMKIADSVSLIKNATDTHRVSLETREKYQSEDAPLQKRNLLTAQEAARDDVEAEEENLEALTEVLLSASMGDESAQATAQANVDASEALIETLEDKEDTAAYNLRIFKQYTYPQRTRELERNVVKAEMGLQKTLVNAAAARVQLEGKINAAKRILASQLKQCADLVENISMLNIYSPVDGVLSFGDPNPRRRHQTQKDIDVGISMKASELIGTIPDMSQLVANLDVPESSRSKVKAGMRAEMRIKALPNIHLTGEVTTISDMASHLNFWDRTSPKIYPTKISVNETFEELRPGMTVEVDLISEEVHDVLYVPVEALSVKEGDVYCRIKKLSGPEERKVKMGRSSSSFVEITEGLKEGDRIFLSREEM